MLRCFRTIEFGAALLATAFVLGAGFARSEEQADQRVRLKGIESQLVAGARPAGPVPAAEEVQVTLVLKHASPPSREALARANVQRFSIAQFANRFSADSAVLTKVEAFAQKYQLRIVDSDPVKRRVILSGSATAIASAFGTQLHSFTMQTGNSFHTTGTPPTVPSDLAPDLEAVVGLDSRPILSPHYVVSHAATAQFVSFDPPQIASLYAFPHDVNGAGQTIAIVQFGGGFRQQDLDTYFGSLGLHSPKVTAVAVDKVGNSPGAEADGEVALDIEVAGAVANGAHLVVYFAPNTDQGFVHVLQDAIHDRQQPPSVISISWGIPEDALSSQTINALNSILSDAAALGITVVAAAGDNGSSNGVKDKQFHVDFPASSPYVLACGGTSLSVEHPTESSADTDLGRRRMPTSIPDAVASERVWNNSDGHATGGGVSLTFGRPSYQDSSNIPSHPRNGFNGRGIPDVAGNADPETGYRIRVNGADQTTGGTSAVAPLWAGLIALMNQKLGHSVGFIHDKLYAMSRESFRNIVNGTNDDAGLGSYSARAGWNACTGLGSPDASKILSALTIATATALHAGFGDTMDKVRDVYGMTDQPTNGCGSTHPCWMLTAPLEGLYFFFDAGQKLLYEIRADKPFAGSIEGVRIGDAFDDVVAKVGKPLGAPFEVGAYQGYLFNAKNGVLRCDFTSSKKCVTMFYSMR